MNKQPDFVAELYYYTSEEGGRLKSAWSKYRPQVKFPFSEMQTSGQQLFLDKDVLYPGDTVLAEITIISTGYFLKQLSNGMDFDFREGPRVIGTGKIIKILNESLRRPEAGK